MAFKPVSVVVTVTFLICAVGALWSCNPVSTGLGASTKTRFSKTGLMAEKSVGTTSAEVSL